VPLAIGMTDTARFQRRQPVVVAHVIARLLIETRVNAADPAADTTCRRRDEAHVPFAPPRLTHGFAAEASPAGARRRLRSTVSTIGIYNVDENCKQAGAATTRVNATWRIVTSLHSKMSRTLVRIADGILFVPLACRRDL
jgi:hypothetical protein